MSKSTPDLPSPHGAQLFPLLQVLQEAFPAAGELGGQARPADEALRLRGVVSLGFPSGDVAALSPRSRGKHRGALVDVASFGLYGPSSPLPTYFTQDLIDEAMDGDGRLRDFVDVFNHRLLSLLFRAWRKYRLSVQDPARSRLLHQLRQLLGIDAGDASLPMSQVGLRHRRPASAAAVAAIVKARFPLIRVRVIPCLLRWSPIAEDQRTRLARHGRLARDAQLGRRIQTRNLTFGIECGPLSADHFQALLPGGAWHADLRNTIASINSGLLDWECRLLIEPEALPATRLDGHHALARNARLGGTGSTIYSICLRSQSLPAQGAGHGRRLYETPDRSLESALHAGAGDGSGIVPDA